MKRTLSLVLVLAMAFSMMLGVLSYAATEEPAAETYSASANLMFADTVYLLVAVDCPASVNASAVTLKITNNKTGASTILVADGNISIPTGYDVPFKYTELGAKNMGDELKLEVINGGAVVSTLTYSVLEYALRAEDLGDEDLSNLVEAMITYGSKAQKAFLEPGKTIAEAYTYDLSVDHSLVRLLGSASFEDGSKKAILLEGSDTKIASVTYATDKTIWYNTKLEPLATGKKYPVSYSKDNATVYASLGEAFDMRTYAGKGIITEWCSKDKSTYTITDSNGNATERPTGWFYGGGNILMGSTIDENRKLIWNLDENYVEWTKGSTEIFMNHGNFFTAAMYDIVVANGGKFTISIKVAATDLANVLGTFSLRSFASNTTELVNDSTGKKETVTLTSKNDNTGVTLPVGLRETHKLPLITGAETPGQLYTNYNYFGGVTKPAVANVKIPFSNTDEWITIDIVIDLFAKCKMSNHGKAATKCYSCGDDGIIAVNGVDYRCPACYSGDTMDDPSIKFCETCGMAGTVPTMYYYVNGQYLNVSPDPVKQPYADGVCPSVSADYFNQGLYIYNLVGGCSGKLQSIVVTPFDIVNN